MNKFDDLNKQTMPDPLTGGTQDIYTSKDGTFMMCIPDRAVKCTSSPSYDVRNVKDENGIRTWVFEKPNQTEDAEYEIIQPKQIEKAQ